MADDKLQQLLRRAEELMAMSKRLMEQSEKLMREYEERSGKPAKLIPPTESHG